MLSLLQGGVKADSINDIFSVFEKSWKFPDK